MDMNDHFVEKVVIWNRVKFVEVMIKFKGSRETLVSHQTNHFLVEQKRWKKREIEMITTEQRHRVLNYKENKSVTLEVCKMRNN